MANYYGVARSNYFKVVDREKFEKQMEAIGLDVQSSDDNDGKVMITPSEYNDSGTWPSYYYPVCDDGEQSDEPVDCDIVDIVAPHLVPGEICVLMESGHEKLRYVGGCAVAFDSTGDYVDVRLESIYTLAAEKFKVDQQSISLAEY